MRGSTTNVAFLALACAGLTAFSACGGSEPRQDADEPSGTFEVDVTKAKFPKKQTLAKDSELLIKVKNTGDAAVPNPAVTINGFDRREDNPALADPNRPVFVVNTYPSGSDTAYVGTYAFAKPLEPGDTATFRWSVTAVKAGPYRLAYKVAGGLNGKAKAINEFGDEPRGVFTGTISDRAPNSRVGSDGETVITDGEKEKRTTPNIPPSKDDRLPPGESQTPP